MTDKKLEWRERFKKLRVKRMRDHHWIRVSHLRGFIQNEIKIAGEQAFAAPMGVSQWELHGKKYGYWDYFEAQAEARGIQRAIEALDALISEFKKPPFGEAEVVRAMEDAQIRVLEAAIRMVKSLLPKQ